MPTLRLKAWEGMEVPILGGRRSWTLKDHPQLMVARYKEGWKVFGCQSLSRQASEAGLEKQAFKTRRQLLEALSFALEEE